MDITLAQPRGFCAGVMRAIEIVERALELHGAPVYVYHEIVHNQHVVEDLRSRGAVFVEDLTSIPQGAVTIFSAHGVSRAVVAQAERLSLEAIDATCPLVSKVHRQAQRFVREGYQLIMIGHPGHQEVIGTTGSVDAPVHLVSETSDVAGLELDESAPVAYVTQTTLSLDDTAATIAALQARYPHIVGPRVDDICYATQNRQRAVGDLAGKVDMVLVVGARNSSNSNRLREAAERRGLPAYLVQDETELEAAWFEGIARVGVTSGASTPELLVQRVVAALQARGARHVQELPGLREEVRFRIPVELAAAG